MIMMILYILFSEQSDFMNIKAIMDGKVDNLDQSIYFFTMDVLSNENVPKLLKDQTQHFDDFTLWP